MGKEKRMPLMCGLGVEEKMYEKKYKRIITLHIIFTSLSHSKNEFYQNTPSKF